MYSTSLFFKIKDNTSISDKQHILELFFKSWIDDNCNNEVDYTLESIIESQNDPYDWIEVYRVDFEKTEDAIAIKLKGIPPEFSNYIEIIT